MRRGIPRELQALAEQAKAQDWVITRLASGHYRWTPPQGQPIVIGGAHRTADPRMIKNARASLVRAGLVVPDKKTGRMPATA